MIREFSIKLYDNTDTFVREITNDLINFSTIVKKINAFRGNMNFVIFSEYDEDISGIEIDAIIKVYDGSTLIYNGFIMDILGNATKRTKTLSVVPIESLELTRFFYKIILDSLDVDTIVWQSGTTVRYTFNGSPDLSGLTAGHTATVTSATNASNDGTLTITDVNVGSFYIDVDNSARTDGTDDEASDSPAVASMNTGLFSGSQTMTATDWIKNIIDNYNARITDEGETSFISYTGPSIETNSTSISRAITEKNHFQAIQEIMKFISETSYWYVDPDGTFFFKNFDVSARYTFNIGTDVFKAKYRQESLDMKNRLYFDNQKQSTQSDAIFKQYDDGASQSSFRVRETLKKDGRITLVPTADEFGSNYLDEFADAMFKYPELEVTEKTVIVENDTTNQVSIWDIEVGETVNFRNRSSTAQLYPDNAVIREIKYNNTGVSSVNVGRLEKDFLEEINVGSTSISDQVVNQTVNGITAPIDGADIEDQTITASLKILQNSITDNEMLFADGSGIGIQFNKMYQGSNALFLLQANHIQANEVIAVTANIKDAVITDAKIQTLTASKITAGTIASQEIILSGSVGILRSTNFVTGTSGWQIKGNGIAEFQEITVRGSFQTGVSPNKRIEINNANQLEVYDASNNQIAVLNGSPISGANTIFELVSPVGTSATGEVAYFQARDQICLTLFNDAAANLKPTISATNLDTNTLSYAGLFTADGATLVDGAKTGNATIIAQNLATDGLSIAAVGGGIHSTHQISTDNALYVGEIAAPGTPAANRGAIYEKTDGKLYFKNDAGTETELTQTGSGATTALDNLASVAINTSLISDTNATDDLGSSSIRWRDCLLSRSLGINGTGGNIQVTGSDSSITVGSTSDASDRSSIIVNQSSTGGIDHNIIPSLTGHGFVGTVANKWEGANFNGLFTHSQNIFMFSLSTSETDGGDLRLSSGDKIWVNTSSIRYKKNVRSLHIDPEILYDLNPITFDWKKDGRRDFGLIAEEVHEICPDLVCLDRHGKPNGVKYKMISLLLLQELKNLKEQLYVG